MNAWSPGSWQSRPAAQLPTYPDPAAVEDVGAELARRPPLVLPEEVSRLQGLLAGVARGEGFLLQGGDCAEGFDAAPGDTEALFRLILQMAVVLTFAGGQPVIKVGRIAGQFAKPRSMPTEAREGLALPAWRGDLVNGLPFDAGARTPDPARMLEGYGRSAATLNHLRALAGSGFAGLGNIHRWTLGFVADSPEGGRYGRLADHIGEALAFMGAVGVDPAADARFSRVDFFTSHEALLLPYEQALVRDGHDGRPYAASAHTLWIGDRTRDPDGAHVEWARGIANPLGVKCGPTLDPEDLLRVADRLDPDNAAGRLTLICRFGADEVERRLPPLIQAVRVAGRTPVWACDPMHGNTERADNGYKTRRFGRVLAEAEAFVRVARAEGTHPGGIHLELTGRDVTECLGGARPVTDDALSLRYHTHCDPRLNAGQALELAFLLAEAIRT